MAGDVDALAHGDETDRDEGPAMFDTDLEEGDDAEVEDIFSLIEAGEQELAEEEAEEGFEAEAPETVELEPEEPEEVEEVEAALDELLRERLAGEAAVEYDEEGEGAGERGLIVATAEEKPRPRAPDEFVCRSCFLIKHRRQLADAARWICKDCADPR